MDKVITGICALVASIYFYVISLSEVTEWARLIAAILSGGASIYTFYFFYTKKRKENETNRN